MKTYPIAGEDTRHVADVLIAKGMSVTDAFSLARRHPIQPGPKIETIQAVRAGRFAPPKKGEWYLSGAIVAAYHAPNDLSAPYHLARLVKVTTERVEKHTIEEL